MSFQKLDLATASKYLLCESAVARIFPNPLIVLLFLQNFVFVSLPFYSGREKASTYKWTVGGTCTLFSYIFII